MARWALAYGLALLASQAGGEPVPSFPPSPLGGVAGLSRLSSGLNSFGAIRGDGMAWPTFDINITAPMPGMRLIGMRVPIQVSITPSRPLVLDECFAVFSDAPSGRGAMTVIRTLDTNATEAIALVDEMPKTYAGAAVCAPFFNSKSTAFGDASAEGQICHRPTERPGPRRLWVRVDCRPGNGTGTDNEPLETVAAQSVDFHVSGDPQHATSQIALTDIFTGEGPHRLSEEDEASASSPIQRAERVCGGGGACVKMVADVLEAEGWERYHSIVAALTSHLKASGINIVIAEGSTYSSVAKLRAMREIVSRPSVQRVCEIGFNAGHSALLYLLFGSPTLTVVGFDIGDHRYSPIAATWLLEHFGPRLQVVMGDSAVTVPAFAAMNPGFRCDVIMVDGSHAGEMPLLDLRHMRALANRTEHVLIADDTQVADVSRAIQVLEGEGRLRQTGYVNDKAYTVMYQMGKGLWTTWGGEFWGPTDFWVGRYLF